MKAWIMFATLFAIPLGGPAHWYTERGNQAYEEGRFADALQEYSEAQAHAPDAAELHYDIGNVLYRQQDYAAAIEAFNRALEGAEGELSADAAHNLGNALFKQEKYKEAVDAYRQSLKHRPQDKETIRNLERALRLMQQPPPEPQPQEDPQDQNEDEQQQNPQDQPQPQEQQNPQEKPQPRQPQDQQLTEEQAKRLLDALKEAELEQKQEASKPTKAQKSKAKEKDW